MLQLFQLKSGFYIGLMLELEDARDKLYSRDYLGAVYVNSYKKSRGNSRNR